MTNISPLLEALEQMRHDYRWQLIRSKSRNNTKSQLDIERGLCLYMENHFSFAVSAQLYFIMRQHARLRSSLSRGGYWWKPGKLGPRRKVINKAIKHLKAQGLK